MSYILHFKLFHTCENISDSKHNAPFKARCNGVQWLGDGWYFWVESLFFARSWGRSSPAYRQNGYSVLMYHLEIRRGELLNLVSSPEDQEGLLAAFKGLRDIHSNKQKTLTLSACINWLQKNSQWHWLATKLADYGKYEAIQSRSIKVADTGELTFLKPRIQLCIHNIEKVKLKFIDEVDSGPSKKSPFTGYKVLKNE